MNIANDQTQCIAAIDIGSNSCLLEIGQMKKGRLVLLNHRKEAIRLGSGLDSQAALSQEAMERGWQCLESFAQLLGDLPRHQVRAVATQTLREASNREAFLQKAEYILGCPVEVINGEEEARLIYCGVAQSLRPSMEPRLVVDIGGRSTELSLGRGHNVLHAYSVPVGSVSWAKRYFADGGLSAIQLEEAQTAAERAIAPYQEFLKRQHWRHAYGASGTAGTLAKVLAAQGQRAGWITRYGLNQLHAELLIAGHVDNMHLNGLREELRPLIGGAVSAMRAVFHTLAIARMHVAPGSLRHGVLFDLAKRLWPAGHPE